MFYLALTDLQNAIPTDDLLQATDRDGDGSPDTAVIDAAMNAAEGRVHAKLARRYRLPLDNTDVVLLQWLKPILVDYAWEACIPRADMVPGDLVNRNADHDKVLDSIIKGDIDIPASSPPPASSPESKITWSSCGKQFNGLP